MRVVPPHGMRSALPSVFALLFGPLSAAADGRASDAASLAAFLPWSDAPGVNAARVRSTGVYDGRGSLALDVTAPLTGTLQLAATLDLAGDTFEPGVAIGLDLLAAARHGVDLQLALGARTVGVNTVPAGLVELAAGRAVAGGYVVGSARLDVGDGDERGAVFGLGATRRIARRLHVGVDSELRVDLERGASEPAGEETWRLRAGPVATYVLKAVSVTASAGLVGRQLRSFPQDAPAERGAFVLLGVGAML